MENFKFKLKILAALILADFFAMIIAVFFGYIADGTIINFNLIFNVILGLILIELLMLFVFFPLLHYLFNS